MFEKSRPCVVYSKKVVSVWPLCPLIFLVLLPFVLLGDFDLPVAALEEEGFLPDPIPVNPLWSPPSDARWVSFGKSKDFCAT